MIHITKPAREKLKEDVESKKNSHNAFRIFIKGIG